ncbi:unnamed protein product [Haemonchus placei]|uniref:Uncharacterized protein n=1 Tax=Haemonchus placei TaxID=6290 RepID=A0A0N4WUP2_HAEPC|nr:unnamed protein product [Haemonchus placei]
MLRLDDIPNALKPFINETALKREEQRRNSTEVFTIYIFTFFTTFRIFFSSKTEIFLEECQSNRILLFF